MGFRNHLHVCQHCGLVHATSSSTGPARCMVCHAFMFSEYDPTATQSKGVEVKGTIQEDAIGESNRAV